MNPFSEDNLIEKTAIRIFSGLWGAENFVNAFSDEGDVELGRENRNEVILVKYLRPVLEKLNSDLPSEAIDGAVEEMTRNRSAMSAVNANCELWQIIRDGVSVQIQNDKGEMEIAKVKVIDFNNIENNHFLLVSQMWITGELHTRRPDLIGFINGIPLVFIELKAAHKNLRNAYNDNLRDYKDTIPQIFWYNAFIIISNGIESKVGTITSEYEHFNEWKKVDSEDEEGKVNLETVIKGTCGKERLLDIIENFILFDERQGKTKKAVARYFQLLGVNRAMEKVKNRKENKGRLGVFWHTQGSGKSYSMVFFSQKVLRKLVGNFTFVVVTDRTELDGQIYKNFAACGAVYEDEVRANKIEHLRNLLQEDHRHIFTLIHKFGTKDLSEKPPELSKRSDIIVMADEAHRTQYDRLAQNMRIALPKASFIGFTGTPLIVGEEKTKEAFGDYVSTYNFAQSVSDGATVRLFYENRVPKLDNVNKNLKKDMARVMDFYELEDEAEEKLENEFSTFYHLITREDRLNKVAEDIVSHFVNRGFDGKGMVISIDKKTAARMYIKVKEQMERYISKLRMDFAHANNEREKERIREKIERYEDIDMAVVVSQSQNEIDDMRQFDINMKPIRERIINEDLETKFKDPDSNLRLVFVCAMWITGFDVPNLSTLYLDKPLKNHTLMQTIARANRVYPGKTNGLIVDYVGVFRNLQKALAIYATQEGDDVEDIIQPKDELVELLKESLRDACVFLQKRNLNLDKLLKAEGQEKIDLLDVFVNTLLKTDKIKKKFQSLVGECQKFYSAILPDPQAEEYYAQVVALRVLLSRIKEVVSGDIDVSAVKKDLEDLLDRSILTGEIKTVPKLIDLSGIDFDKLKEFFGEDKKAMLMRKLQNDLEEKIQNMARKNKIREEFLKRLNKLISEYNLGSRDIDSVLEQLKKLADDLSAEEERATREGLSEEELAIFDLLKKDELTPQEEDDVKKIAVELLAKLKTELLIQDWRNFQPRRAAVKVAINDYIYELPQNYNEEELPMKSNSVYIHVYDNYVDAKNNVYM
ncbi:type I restriction endonuclease subunit R [Candidatus Parcubacteria bacterium]|nr:type I restriction endonuclease subunit R [Candidatus Parcubacteria bacterium]